MLQDQSVAWRRSGVERRNHERRAIGGSAVLIDGVGEGQRVHGRRLMHRRAFLGELRDRRIGDQLP